MNDNFVVGTLDWKFYFCDLRQYEWEPFHLDLKYEFFSIVTDYMNENFAIGISNMKVYIILTIFFHLGPFCHLGPQNVIFIIVTLDYNYECELCYWDIRIWKFYYFDLRLYKWELCHVGPQIVSFIIVTFNYMYENFVIWTSECESFITVTLDYVNETFGIETVHCIIFVIDNSG